MTPAKVRLAMAALGFLCLLSVHDGIYRARKEKFQRENDKIDNTIIY